ncbi:MAG: DUF262 domain-containing protein [Treponema sp.]|nr:DUF262 domain-containing protein [Treponema sp.]
MEEKNTSELKQIIKDIEDENILLPNFQREFTWKDEKMQKGLVCSVLSRMPVGSILLLKSKEREFGCRKIGLRSLATKKDDKTEVQYLLDGQQRLTVLSNVFSNVVYENFKDFRDLSSESLKRRFFVKLPFWKTLNQNAELTDLFGLRKLEFSINNPDIEYPSFLTGDIEPYVTCLPFLAKDGAFYNPMKPIDNDLKKACINYEKGYLIPLFLLAPTEKNLDSSNFYLKKIIEGISNEIADEIKDYANKLDSDARTKFIASIVKDENEFDDQLSVKADIWSGKMLSFLNACTSKLCLHQIILNGEDRSRAIDIYENLNKGGVTLSTFDLIVAKVAKVSPDSNFYERIRKNISSDENKKYDFSLIPDDVRGYAEKANYTNASKTIKVCEDNASKDIAPNFTDPFLNILGITYSCKNSNFSDVKIDFTKRENLLNISPEFIDENCERICTALDRAYFFFQTRCGIRKVSEINYKWIISIVSLVFMNEVFFFDKKIHNLLEAWYWGCIFSGEFDTDQNEKAIKNIKLLFKTLNNQGDKQWLFDLNNRVFNCQNFSTKDFILMENAKFESYPKAPFRRFICQYYLSRTYEDLLSDTVLSVFYKDVNSLEAHHLLPVGQYKNYEQNSSVIRNDDKHICNSPVNFVYITPETNKEIGKEDLHSYVSRITAASRASLNISGAFTEDICKELIDDNKSLDKRLEIAKKILADRFDLIKGSVQKRIKSLLGA